jgi:hypothetical protein
LSKKEKAASGLLIALILYPGVPVANAGNEQRSGTQHRQ